MAENLDSAPGHPKLDLTTEEKRVYGQLFRAADPDGFGAVSGDVAVSFFEKTTLPADVLGEIWQIADTENRGLLTPPGFSIVLRLIGHAQAGRVPSADLASQPGPLPRFDGSAPGAPSTPMQNTGPQTSPNPAGPGPIRVPSLSPEKLVEYASLFEKSGAENGQLSGVVAKRIFERARLPNEVLGRIWNLADTQSRGVLDATEFAIAMHLLASYKSGAMRGVPQTLPPGLYEAAARRAPSRTSTGSFARTNTPPAASFPPSFTAASAGRPQSPLTRQQMGTPLSAQSTGDGWAVSHADKVKFDQIFAGVDKVNRGFITGDQAVEFFGNARLSDETLAQIWDLADINSEGRLNRDGFAVAMYLIRQQRGTKEGRGNLPTTLPPALVPPMMRQQQAPPSQPTAPAFDNAPITKARSAADDLFGLDAISSAPTQAPQSTGGSISGGPLQNPKTSPRPPTSSSPAPSTTFKPFVPSSSFGQSLAPQQTGASPGDQSRSPQAPASDDLLGDADPEVSQKLTSETSELANLSNQVGNLAKQTQDVQSTKASTAHELSQGGQQKKEFETRLSQLRTLYEKEVNDTKALQGQLSTQRTELKRLQQDMAMLEGGLQDLRGQRQQLSTTLEAESREKAVLNEKIKAANAEMNELKPRLEKMKSETRQQKGLVAISKKQLATLDGEKDRLQDELNTAKYDLDEGKQKAEEKSGSPPPTSSVTSPANVASPAASVMSTKNPFFRRGTGQSDATFPAPVTSPEQTGDRDRAFDSMFGPSASPHTTSSQQTPFDTHSPPQSRQMSGIDNVASTSSALSSPNEPTFNMEPPAPPKSRQITSAALPFRTSVERSDSLSSSVKVAPPASQMSPADTPRALTPSVMSASSAADQNGASPDPDVKAYSGGEKQTSSISSSPVEEPISSPADEAQTLNDEINRSDSSQDIPGAFPQMDTPRSEIPPAALAAGAGAAGLAAGGAAALMAAHANDDDTEQGTKSEDPDSAFDQYFGGPAHTRSSSDKATDFESAFATMKQPTTNGNTGERNEFPPIRELDEDDSDDSSEAAKGFDDNFTGASPPRESATTKPEVASAVPQSMQARPSFSTVPSTNSSLPEVEAQRPPPTYGESVPNDNPDQFPPEFKGLLPHRGDPTSLSHESTHSPQPETEGPTGRKMSQPYGPETSKSPPAIETGAGPSTTGPQPNKPRHDDFDSAFADMTPAPVVDDDEDEDVDDGFDTGFGNSQSTFDPSFDSPATTRSTTAPQSMAASSQLSTTTEPPNADKDMRATNAFYNFFGGSNNSQPTAASGAPAAAQPANTNDTNAGLFKNSEWDDMFAGLDKSGPTSSSPLTSNHTTAKADQTFAPPPGPPPPPTSDDTGNDRSQPPAASSSLEPPPPPTTTTSESQSQSQSTPDRPPLDRGQSTGTEHDDPILKRLTAMGWSRDDSLQALEKFDYNLDKAADYLTFNS